jgi:hypothetical protein
LKDKDDDLHSRRADHRRGARGDSRSRTAHDRGTQGLGSALFTALNSLPSIATLVAADRKRVATLIDAPRSFRSAAIVPILAYIVAILADPVVAIAVACPSVVAIASAGRGLVVPRSQTGRTRSASAFALLHLMAGREAGCTRSALAALAAPARGFHFVARR